MSSILIIPAEVQPVSVAELAAHVNLGSDYASVEADLTIKLLAAIGAISEATGRRQICEATWELCLPSWPCSIDMDIPQVSAIESIKYTDSEGSPHTVSAADYKLVGAYDPDVPTQTTGRASIVPAYGKSWPTATLDVGLPIVVTYVAGWVDAASVPALLKAAILLEGGHLYRDRESVTVGNTQVTSAPLARGVDSLIAPYTVWSF